MQVRVTGITVDMPTPVCIRHVLDASRVSFGTQFAGDAISLDGTPRAVEHVLPACVDALLRAGRHLLLVNHDGAGHWSARLLTIPGT